MSEPNQHIAGIETPDAEVELSAQDLLELSAPAVSGERAPEPVSKMPTGVLVPGLPPLQTRTAAKATARKMSTSQLAASVVFAIGAIGFASYYAVVSYEARQSAAVAKEQAPRSQASAVSSEGKPVRFANPFDPNEVFEFPAGTTEAQARDAVAQVLMERAMERQRQFDARVSSNS